MTTGPDPLAALPWGLPALLLGLIAGFYARPEGRTPSRQTRTGYLAILGLIAAGVCAYAMLAPRWRLGYGILFGAWAIAALAFGRLWNPAQRRLAIAGGLAFVAGTAAIAIAIPRWSPATPYLALVAAAGAGAIGVVVAQRVPRSTA